ncbi:Ig-like domain-containing protein [Paenibacillus glycanilyticus]|uniref:Ig-like domain-containing protein n=1 Tax=Paenibacillus glycanilyticus TaxID=126569 RepID=UPI00203EE815|nr:Ig-like domain-containing protein [Paenibacillus glycanilyticus]MCM3629584.1 Ig-like domain-containing protein [Paenibacillus glycanilyticus]
MLARTSAFTRIALLLLVLGVMLAVTHPTATKAAVNVVDIKSNAMNFTNYTLISGQAGIKDAVYKYTNVITRDGITIDAKVTIKETNNASLATNTLDNNVTNLNDRFNPWVTTTQNNGYLTFHFDFIDQATGDPVSIKNFFVTVIDIDGSSSSAKEFVEMSGFASYSVNNPTQLVIGAGSNGRTKFAGRNSSLNGTTFENTASVIVNYTAPISGLDLVTGNTSVLSERQFSINFGAPGGTFTTPVQVDNGASPTIDVTIDDGGDGKLTAGQDNVGSVKVSGSSNAGTGQPVTLTVKDSTGTERNYATTVGSDGKYSVQLDFSDLKYGTITVAADTVNAQGNPAKTATDTTNKVNTAPVAEDASFSGDEDTVFNKSLSDKGSDIDGDSIIYSLVTAPMHGTITLNANGSFTYTPNANYNGPDSFTYKVNDVALNSSAATVTLTVNPVNDAPVANNSSTSTLEGTPVDGTVTATDIDQDLLLFQEADLPQHGNLQFDGIAGTYTYTPDDDFIGTDTFTFTAHDGTDESNKATVTITVTAAPNAAPVAQDGSESTNEDTPVNGAVSATDADNNTLTYTLVTAPVNGTVVMNADGTFTYTPNANYNGTDSFTFKANDGKADSNVATVNLTINAVNDAPTANNSSKITDENIAVSGTVTGQDVEGTSLTYSLDTVPVNGTVVFNIDGTYTYTPNHNYSGSDSFTFVANDGALDSAPATVTITINEVNEAPVAQNDTLQTEEDKPLDGSALATDSDGDSLQYSVVGQPSHGDVTMNSNGTFTYTPDANYNGPDSFTFKANDGSEDSNTASISITITAVNDAPTADASSKTTAEDTAVSGSVTGQDIDSSTLTYVLVTEPEHGTLAFNPDGTYTYTPDKDFNGSDSFTFKANDGSLDSAPATVTITVTPVNDDPSAVNSGVTTNEDTPINNSVSANDADNDTITYTVVTAPEHGTLTLNPDGTYTYTPDPNFNGEDTFTFEANDGHGGKSTGTVTITVTPVNDAPVADAGTKTTTEDTPVSGTVTGQDVENNTLTYTLVTEPEHGTVILNPDGTYTYTPDPNYNGPDSFTFKANDGSADSSPAKVDITVTPVNDAPGSENSSVTTAEDKQVSDKVKASDVDGDSLTYTLVNEPDHGTITFNQDGTFTYTPNPNYNGPDSFTFTANDGQLDSPEATVSITVTPVNDAPTADAGSNTTPEDQPVTGTVTGGDVDGTTPTYVIVTEPEHGTVVLNPNGTYTYTPDPNYNGPDSFTFKANDGTADSAPAKVDITVTAVNDAPTASNDTAVVDSGSSVTDSFIAQDVDGDSLTFSVVTQPAHGTVVINNDGTYTYTPTAGYGSTDSFTFKANDGSLDSNTAEISITVRLLDGWVGDRSVTDNSEWTVAPNKPLKISAITDISATAVKAAFDFDGPDNGTENDTLTLTLANEETYLTDGFKKWENVQYRLPAEAASGAHAVTFTASKGETALPAEPASKLQNNNFTVVRAVSIDGTVKDHNSQAPIEGAKVTLYDPTGTNKVTDTTTNASGYYSFPNVRTEHYLIVVEKQGYATRNQVINALPGQAAETTIHQNFELVKYILKLTANPSSIVGDGHTISKLTAVLTDMDGKPLKDVNITFSASLGTFLGGSPTAVTDAAGKATIQYQSSKIEGILSQSVPVTATANDVERSIYAKEQIIITFEPASVTGVVATTDNGTRTIVAGAVVKITKDFDGDGVIDFAAEAVTDADGKYSIAVPRGDESYNIEVIKTVQVGGQTKEVSFKQTVEVGAVSGNAGEVFESTKTITGLLTQKLPTGQNDTLKQEFMNQVTVKLIGPAPDHKEFSAPLKDGVFNIPGLERNTEYQIAIIFKVPDAEHGGFKDIIINALDNNGTLPTIKLAANGEMNILNELIDPYGDITDNNTHAAIDGATVKLYYANTPRNITNGNTPGTEVKLPEIVGFAPSDNANPQTSKDGGKYAYMVYPTTDYYIVATAPGYVTYTSPTIPVEFAIVRHDIQMSKAAVTPAGKPNVVVNVSVDKDRQEENTAGKIKVEYLNNGTKQATGATVTLTLPEGTTVTKADGGKVEGNKVTWNVGDLNVGDKGVRNVEVKYPSIKETELLVTISVEGKASQELLNPEAAKASVKVLLFKTGNETVKHQRYILGFPDGKFKPSQKLTRAELAAIIARLLNGGSTTLKADFKDVPSTQWASGYIRIVTDSGIFKGFADGTFRPNQPVTREELATVMVRYLKLETSMPITPQFGDSDGRWSSAAIEALFRNGLTTGYPDGTFQPGKDIVRLEAVTLINRLLYRGPLTDVEPSFPDVKKSNWAFGQVEEATRSHEATRTSDGNEHFVKALDDNVK